MTKRRQGYLVYTYNCFKCGKRFFLNRDLDTDKPTCNECFADLLKIRTAEEYKDFIK